MSATLVSSNTTLKVNAAISATTSFSGTLYTAPANGYAIVNLSGSSSGGTTLISIGGRPALSTTGFIIGQTAFVGPSQSVTAAIGTGIASISGVEFVNTP